MITGGRESRELHSLFYKVMEGYEDPSAEVTLHEILAHVQEFFLCNYLLGINPLRELRRMLPQYTWQYHRSKNRGEIGEAVSHSDFIWRLNWHDVDDPEEATEIMLVTAVSRDTTTSSPDRPKFRSNFWSGVSTRRERYKRTVLAERIKFIRGLRGIPVYWAINRLT